MVSDQVRNIGLLHPANVKIFDQDGKLLEHVLEMDMIMRFRGEANNVTVYFEKIDKFPKSYKEWKQENNTFKSPAYFVKDIRKSEEGFLEIHLYNVEQPVPMGVADIKTDEGVNK